MGSGAPGTSMLLQKAGNRASKQQKNIWFFFSFKCCVGAEEVSRLRIKGSSLCTNDIYTGFCLKPVAFQISGEIYWWL